MKVEKCKPLQHRLARLPVRTVEVIGQVKDPPDLIFIVSEGFKLLDVYS